MAEEPDADILVVDGEDDSEDSDSSSSSDDQEIEVDAADMEQLMKLEADLEGNPNLYDSHVKVT